MLIQVRNGELIEELEEHYTYRDDAQSLAIWAKGYFFDSQGHLYCDGEISEWLAGQLRTRALGEIVPRMNGVFAVVVLYDCPASIICATDRLGTIPLYYQLDADSVVISDDYWSVVQNSEPTTFKESSVLDMICLGYVTGQKTLLEGILEMPGATICVIHHNEAAWNATKTTYWRLNYAGEKRHGSEEALEREFADLLASIMQRFVENVNARGWDVAFALSGGLDSRLLISLFKRHGCRDISAYSYGSPQHPDVAYATQIARALDIPHWVVPVEGPDFITEDLIEEMSRTVGATTRFTCGLGGRIVQDALPGFSVYIMGHRGFRLWAGDESVIRHKSQAARLLRHNYFLCTDNDILDQIWSSKNHRAIISNTINRTLDFDPGDPIGSMRHWDNAQDHRRLIAREMRTYERFGRWMLPLADYDLVDYVATLPLQHSMHERLYVNSMISNVYTKDLEKIRQIPRASGGAFTRRGFGRWEQFKLAPKWPLLKDVVHVLQMTKKAVLQRKNRYKGGHDPAGADPFDFWWATSAEFRANTASIFEGWDGLGGMIDTGALLSLLRNERLPRYFLLFGIPSLLTLVFVQRIVQRNSVISNQLLVERM